MKKEASNGTLNEFKSSLVDMEGQEKAIDRNGTRNDNIDQDKSKHEDDLEMVKFTNLDGYNEY